MRPKAFRARLEPLETRIAPATFLVGGLDLKVRDVTNPAAVTDANDLQTEKDAATNVGVDFAFLQSAGDKLFFDSNFNGKADATDFLLVQVDTGKAMVFLNDRDGDGLFSPDELTGLAVSTNFSATLKGDVA